MSDEARPKSTARTRAESEWFRAQAALVQAHAGAAEAASTAAHNLGSALSGLGTLRGAVDTHLSPDLAADIDSAASEAVAALRRVVAAVDLAPPPAAAP